MKKQRVKIFSIVMCLLFAVGTIAVLAPITSAAPGSLKTYAYVGALPNPIGVNQPVLIRLGITDQLATNDYGWTGLTVTITKPDGTTQTLGPFKTDSTGGTYTTFTPTAIGNYTLQAFFPQQTNPASISSSGLVIPAGTIMLASQSEVVTLVVQSEPIKGATSQALPTEYWTRPINNQYQSWQTIGGNWLTASNTAGTTNRIAYGNDYAPQSPHVLWNMPITEGGLVGGSDGYITGGITDNRISIGDAYQGRFLYSVIMMGVLYYDNYPYDNYAPLKSHQYTAVNLHTGEVLWTKTLLNNLTLSRGQLMQWNSINVVGTFPYLWATANAGTLPLLGLPSTAGTTWCAFDPNTGNYVYSIYGIPSGSIVFGENGEILIYTVNSAKGYMTLWNSTNIPALYGGTEVGSTNIQQWNPEGKVVNGTGLAGTTLNGKPASYYLTPTGYAGYMWNASIPKNLPGSVISVLDDRIIGGTYSATGVNLWAVSIKASNAGTLLFNKAWAPPSDWTDGNVTISWQATSSQSENGIVVFGEKETRQVYAFSAETGAYLWTSEPHDYLDFYTMGTGGASARSVNQIYDGKFYSAGYAGVLYCYDCLTGEVLWTYTATNPTSLGSAYSQWPLYPMFIANGMIYVVHTEHSGFESSLPVDAPMICINATTGAEIWRADGLIRGTHWGGYPIIGDSIIAALNTYDMQIYAIGKGPSSTTVEAPMTGVTVGSSLVIRGTVTDVSPGTKQVETTMRFPNGVAAVSDASMPQWMKYVYQQTSAPTDVKGVDVVISVVDANGNYRTIGTATSDSMGAYSFAWSPDIAGKYTVIASFAGSASYYGSSAESSFVADSVAATVAPTPAPQSTADMYIVPGIIGIIAAIFVVGALLAVLLLKRHP